MPRFSCVMPGCDPNRVFESLPSILGHLRMKHGVIGNDPTKYRQLAEAPAAPLAAPAAQPAAPAGPQYAGALPPPSSAMTEETGQRVCKGIECLTQDIKALREQFTPPAAPAAPAPLATPIVPPAGGKIHGLAGNETPETTGHDNHDHHGEESRDTAEVIDHFLACPRCKPVLQKKVLAGMGTLFPGKVIRDLTEAANGREGQAQGAIAGGTGEAGVSKPEGGQADASKPSEGATDGGESKGEGEGGGEEVNYGKIRGI